MTQAQDQHKGFELDTSKGSGNISGEAIGMRFQSLIDSDIILNMRGQHWTDDCLQVPVQILSWRIEVNVEHDGHAVVQWQFKPKHGEGTVWITSTSDEYSVIS